MSGVDAHTRVRISPNVYCRAFGEELVLLDFARGEYFALDEIGAVIFRALEEGKPIEDIAATVASRYDVDAATALGDIVPLVQQMRDEGLVSVI